MFNIERYQKAIDTICRKYRVKRLTVFGSALTNDFDNNSDIDFLLELEHSEDGLCRYMNIKFELESLFTRPVDIVMPKALRNPRLKESVYSKTREIYAA